jgi:acyl-CoA synthetase (NDP forming)
VLARGSVPSYQAPENAARALAEVVRYAQWRRRPVGDVPELAGVNRAAARSIVRRALGSPGGTAGGVRLDAAAAAELLRCYGIAVWPALPAATADEAASAAARLGYPVVLKARAPGLRHRFGPEGVRLDLADDEALREAFAGMAARLGGAAAAQVAVQAMAEPGVATVVRLLDDPSFGAVVSFGIAGVATELLGDLAYRILPLTALDAHELVRSARASPLLFGYRGTDPVDVAALEELLLRVSRVAEDLPEIAELALDPVVVAGRGLAVLEASVRLVAPPARVDLGARALSEPR